MLAKDIPQHRRDNLMAILEHCELEDLYIRQRMLREAKQLELYWHGFQFIFWDERSQDFRIPTQEVMEEMSTREDTKYIYDYVVNTFKAHGLSIIAALSAEVPGVPFSPRNPDDPKDVLAAMKAEQLGKIIMKGNRAKMQFYHALFLLYTNHYIAAYNYYERDKQYGTANIPKYGKQTIKQPDTFSCQGCGFNTEIIIPSALCPECNDPLKTIAGDEKEENVKVGTEEINLGMSKIRVRSTLTTKIPLWAADQPACGYLIDYYDQHYSYLRYIYPDLRDEIDTGNTTDNFERIMRMPSLGRLYSDTYLSNLQTLKRIWLRPHMFEILDKHDAEDLKKAFPEGVFFAVIGDNYKAGFAEAEPSNLDDCWTIAKGDLSRAVHGDPLGKPLVGMQDIENMTTNLMIESMEQSIPSTWADPAIIDFDKYSHQEVIPGALYPIKESISSASMRGLDSYFYTLKAANLSKEQVDFDGIIQNKSQFLVGAFPSIFGGPQTEGSKTLGEYQESRNYALQRLSIPYQILFFWWADSIHKGVKIHIAEMIDEEIHSQQIPDGKFVCIKLLADDFKAGRFNLLIPEGATDLPISFSQKRSNITQLVQLNNEKINDFLFSAENRHVTLRFLSLEEFSDLDSTQACKQIMEIDDMQTGPVEIEPTLDDDEIHLRILKNFMSSPYGQEVKKEIPQWYNWMMQHAEAHYNHLQQIMMNQQEIAAKGQLLKNTKVKSSAPIDQVLGEVNSNTNGQQNQPQINQPSGVQ